MKLWKKKEVTSTTDVDYEMMPTIIEPLKLHIDFGRQDLNDVFQKVEDKINELIKKK